MSALFIITVFLLAAVAYTIYRKGRELNSYRTEYELGRSSPRSLFDGTPDADELMRQTAADSARAEGEGRAALLERAAAGDYTALADAHRTGDETFYQSALSALLAWANGSADKLSALAAFVTSDTELRGSKGLADSYFEVWKQTPDAATTARLLHLAALSDDPETFGRALDAAVAARREGKLPNLSAADLRSLAEGEFWVLSSESRASGAGFVLKRRLAALVEELST